MKTILAPIDFSKVSRKVIDEAISLARLLKGRVVLLHAVPPPAVVSDLAPLVGEALQFSAEVERSARRHLQRLTKSLADRGVPLEFVCEQGFPVQIILTHAEQLPAHYIVLGSHGHTAFYDLVIGSAASGVLKHARCPVIVVPAAPATKPAARPRKKR